jgi:hypothetical protein
MSSINEKGHAKNVANFARLISFCEATGQLYNPANTALKIENLNVLLKQSGDSIDSLILAKTKLEDVTNSRQILFSGLQKKSTQVLAIFKSSGATPEAVADVATIVRKLRGERSKGLTRSADEKSISVSRLSFTSKVDSFANILARLKSSKIYNPNESDFKVSSLENLKKANTEIDTAQNAYNLALSNRDRVIYDPNTGLVETAKNIKTYLKGILGTANEDYKKISGIGFETNN